MTALCAVADCRDRDGNPRASAAPVCPACRRRVRWALAEIPARYEAAGHRLAGRPSSGERVVVRASRDVGISLDPRVVEERATARNRLVAMVRAVAEDSRLGYPADTVHAMSAWLTVHLDALLDAEYGAESADELLDSWRALGQLDDVSPRRLYLGPCSCGEDVTAREQDEQATCGGCGATYPADERWSLVWAQTEDALGTAREAADLASRLLGVPVAEATVRKWRERGRLQAHGERDGRTLYRLGDVYDLVGIMDARTRARSA